MSTKLEDKSAHLTIYGVSYRNIKSSNFSLLPTIELSKKKEKKEKKKKVGHGWIMGAMEISSNKLNHQFGINILF